MRKHPLLTFFVLAFVLRWWIYPLLRLLTVPYGVAALAIAVTLQAARSSRSPSPVSDSPALGKP